MEAIVIKIAFAFFFSFLICFYLIPMFCTFAQRLNFVDKPDGKVKTHDKAIPYLGGLAIYTGFLSGLALTIPFDSKILFLLIGISLLLFLGLVDDFLVLRASQKFFGQAIIALSFLKAGFYLKEHLYHNIWNMPLSLFWILSVINAFNLIDVMDGLATTVAICATITLFVIAVFLHHHIVMILLAAFLGPLFAFLWYNKPPARIYLGDAGSLYIGGFLATIPFLFDWGTYTWYGYLAPAIILAIPLLECFSLIMIRTYKGIPFYQASPDHFSIYLKKAGWSIKSILFYVLLLSVYLGAHSLLFISGLINLEALLLSGSFFLIVWIAVLMRR